MESRESVERLKLAAAERHENPQDFVEELQKTMADLRVPLSDRNFRKSFSRNYRVLFQANPFGYRVEVLESVLELTAEIWVNRRLHFITGLAMRKGFLLQQRLCQLFSLLEGDVLHNELREKLQELDQAWMQFEKHYILDLIDIEAEARRPLGDAVDLELELRQAESVTEEVEAPRSRRLALHRWSRAERETCEESACTLPAISKVSQSQGTRSCPDSLDLQRLAESATAGERREKMKELLSKVALVNGYANGRGRGRPIMGYHVLESAADDFLAPAESEPEAMAAQAFAEHVLTGFLQLRTYLFDMRGRLLEVDPQLRNNARLQNCLVAWEDAWELGARFLRPREMLSAVCSLSVQLSTLQEDHASFAELVETQEAELFLVLPRLVLLCSLATPDVAAPWAANMLPSHFAEEHTTSLLGSCFSRARRSSEWEELVSKFQTLKKERSWQQLVHFALRGPSSAEDEDVKAFLTELESFVFELTRRRPEDWNNCSSLLLHCSAAVLDEARKREKHEVNEVKHEVKHKVKQ